MSITNSREERLWTNTFLIRLRQGKTYFEALMDADRATDSYHIQCMGYQPDEPDERDEPNEPNEPAEPDEPATSSGAGNSGTRKNNGGDNMPLLRPRVLRFLRVLQARRGPS